MKIKHVAAAVAIALGSVYANANSFSSASVALDTPTNLDVSWTWNLSQVTGSYDSSVAPLTYWSAEAWGWKQSLRSSSVYIIDVIADHIPNALTYEYEAGTFANNPLVHYFNSAQINGRTYNLTIDSDQSNSSLWNVHLTAAVPEPESYAMFLAGLGLMGVIARRRRSA